MNSGKYVFSQLLELWINPLFHELMKAVIGGFLQTLAIIS